MISSKYLSLHRPEGTLLAHLNVHVLTNLSLSESAHQLCDKIVLYQKKYYERFKNQYIVNN